MNESSTKQFGNKDKPKIAFTLKSYLIDCDNLFHGIANGVLSEICTRVVVIKKRNLRCVYFPAIYTEYSGFYCM